MRLEQKKGSSGVDGGDNLKARLSSSSFRGSGQAKAFPHLVSITVCIRHLYYRPAGCPREPRN